MQDSPKSDLIDLVNHEHHHLTQLFGSLHATFEALANGALDPRERSEVVETAAEDLQTAFDDLPVSLNIKTDTAAPAADDDDALIADLRSALTNLQYPPALVENAIEKLTPLADPDEDLQALVRRALKLLRG